MLGSQTGADPTALVCARGSLQLEIKTQKEDSI